MSGAIFIMLLLAILLSFMGVCLLAHEKALRERFGQLLPSVDVRAAQLLRAQASSGMVLLLALAVWVVVVALFVIREVASWL